MLESGLLIPAIGLSKFGPTPPVNAHAPPKLLGLKSSILTPRMRPPNLSVCRPFCIWVKLFSSQLFLPLVACPTDEHAGALAAQPAKAPLTFKVATVLSPRDSLRLWLN